MNLDKLEPLLKRGSKRLNPSAARSRINRVGLELEGGWKKLPKGMPAVVHDGSVRFPATVLAEMTDRQTGNIHVGEIPSKPLELGEWAKWLKDHYPEFVNQTCGLHVHMSFRSPLMYMRLMEEDYTQGIVRFVKDWATEQKLPRDHPIWPRLAGKSEYCQPRFDAERQVLQTKKNYNRDRNGGSRYTMVNYCHGLHSTLECRLLPMFEDPLLAISAVQRVLDITNGYLLLNAKREKAEKLAIEASEDSFMEEIKSCV